MAEVPAGPLDLRSRIENDFQNLFPMPGLLPRLVSLAAFAAMPAPALAAPAAEPLAVGREYLMGTIAEIRIHAMGDPAQAGDVLETAFAELRALDRLLAVQHLLNRLRPPPRPHRTVEIIPAPHERLHRQAATPQR